MNPDNLPVAVCCLLLKDGLVLATARKYDNTLFGLPGGKVEAQDASMRHAAVRELAEETGIDTSPELLVECFSAPCVDRFGVHRTHWNVVYLVTDWRGEPTSLPGEGAVAWVTWETLFAGPFGDYNRAVHAALGV